MVYCFTHFHCSTSEKLQWVKQTKVHKIKYSVFPLEKQNILQMSKPYFFIFELVYSDLSLTLSPAANVPSAVSYCLPRHFCRLSYCPLRHFCRLLSALLSTPAFLPLAVSLRLPAVCCPLCCLIMVWLRIPCLNYPKQVRLIQNRCQNVMYKEFCIAQFFDYAKRMPD